MTRPGVRAAMFQTVLNRALSGTVLLLAVPALSLWLRTRGKTREELYDVLYSMNWGETTTNNLGFAPAEGDGAERFQLQMYEELYKLLRTHGGARGRERLLEVSCGRGGGFNYLVKRWEGPLRAVGLDLSPTAIEHCKRRCTGLCGDVEFIHGSALELPFEDASLDVVVNVEASHIYSDDRVFFQEAQRVLRPGGVLLFADFRRRRHEPTSRAGGRRAAKGKAERRICTCGQPAMLRKDNSGPWPKRCLDCHEAARRARDAASNAARAAREDAADRQEFVELKTRHQAELERVRGKVGPARELVRQVLGPGALPPMAGPAPPMAEAALPSSNGEEPVRLCRNCRTELPWDAPLEKVYCDQDCKEEYRQKRRDDHRGGLEAGLGA
jgi:SAM-dependent methyltransferase